MSDTIRAQHTPGPWTIWDTLPQCVISGYRMIADCHSAVGNHVEAKANARLIASAPDLLEALEALTLAANSNGRSKAPLLRAISKALHVLHSATGRDVLREAGERELAARRVTLEAKGELA